MERIMFFEQTWGNVLTHLLALQPEMTHFIFSGFSFLIYNIRIIVPVKYIIAKIK